MKMRKFFFKLICVFVFVCFGYKSKNNSISNPRLCLFHETTIFNFLMLLLSSQVAASSSAHKTTSRMKSLLIKLSSRQILMFFSWKCKKSCVFFLSWSVNEILKLKILVSDGNHMENYLWKIISRFFFRKRDLSAKYFFHVFFSLLNNLLIIFHSCVFSWPMMGELGKVADLKL